MYRLGIYRLTVESYTAQSLLFRIQCRLVCHAVFVMLKQKTGIALEQAHGKETLLSDRRFYYRKKICYRFFQFVGVAHGNA